MSAGDADAVVAHRRPRRRSPVALRASPRCAPPRVGVLGGVVEQVGEHLRQAHRVAVARSAARPAASTRELVAARRRSAAGWSRPRAASSVAEVERLAAQLDLAARDARDLEQVVDQPHHVVDLALHHRRDPCADLGSCVPVSAQELRARCGSAPAGCAARARASRGTRPCAGRPRAAPRRRARARRGASRIWYWRWRARSAVRTALTSAATRTGRSSSVTLPSMSHAPRATAGESAPGASAPAPAGRTRAAGGRRSSAQRFARARRERLLGQQQRAGAALELGARARRRSAQPSHVDAGARAAARAVSAASLRGRRAGSARALGRALDPRRHAACPRRHVSSPS